MLVYYGGASESSDCWLNTALFRVQAGSDQTNEPVAQPID